VWLKMMVCPHGWALPSFSDKPRSWLFKVLPYVFLFGFTLWLFNIAMEHGPFIDGLPVKNGDFPWLCWITRRYIMILIPFTQYSCCLMLFNAICLRQLFYPPLPLCVLFCHKGKQADSEHLLGQS
jgi:hypothetical protein